MDGDSRIGPTRLETALDRELAGLRTERGEICHLLGVPKKANLEAIAVAVAKLHALAVQISDLADFIMAEVPGEPSQNEGAVHTAIRVIRRLQEELASAVSVGTPSP